MTTTPPALPSTIACVPVTSAEEAERVSTHLIEVTDALEDVLQQETELVRGGQLGAAAKLYQSKGDFTQLYLADTLRLRASQPAFSKLISVEQLDALRHRHDRFRMLLQINLTVLATAHAVSEGIVRGVSGELARKAAPQTYGASGRTVMPSPNAAQPLAVSRSM
jgi:hypothetical protein